MRKRIPIKNHHQEILLTTKRSMVGLLFIFTCIFLLTLRLAYLQINKNEVYNTLATNNWLDVIPVEPTRGLIFDRHGLLLAENIPVFSLDVIPNQVKNLSSTLAAVKEIVDLSENDVTQFKRQLRQHRHFDEIPLKLRLNEAEVARFTENQYRFPGLIIKGRLIRHYPYGNTFSHVLGYVGRINTDELNQIDTVNYSASNYIGKLGIEKYYENDLHGQVGYEQAETDASGKPLRVIKEIKGTPGKNLYLTIDAKLQFVAEKALNGLRGALVAIDPNNGEILALVSTPTYDPNLFVAGINQTDFSALQNSPDRPLFNRALRGLYPLASTIKPFLGLAGLEAEIITADDYIDDTGSFQIHNNSHIYHDWLSRGHGKVNLTKAIMLSCDTFFYELSNKLGIKRMDDMLGAFGFGHITNVDLGEELPGLMASPEWKYKTRGLRWYEGDTILAGIGQGYMQATPLQLANATATLGMRGTHYQPHLLLGKQLPTATFEANPTLPSANVTLNDPENWDEIIEAMQLAVDSPIGTAHWFGKHTGYTLAAKTGTGQIVARRGSTREENKQEYLPERLRDHHLFIAFAPVKKPKLALAIITENSNSAVIVARTILSYYLGTAEHANQPISPAVEKTSNDR